jgi:hypothetical protein
MQLRGHAVVAVWLLMVVGPVAPATASAQHPNAEVNGEAPGGQHTLTRESFYRGGVVDVDADRDSDDEARKDGATAAALQVAHARALTVTTAHPAELNDRLHGNAYKCRRIPRAPPSFLPFV